MLFEFHLKADKENFYDITDQVRQAITESNLKNGLVLVYCPHTTAAITVNENADPDVIYDMLLGLRKAYPDDPNFRHGEGNSTAHIKSSVIGNTQSLLFENGCLALGTWQGVYFCEFDPPRRRHFFVKVMGE